MKLILASASPRRAELLRTITDAFEVIPSHENEEVDVLLDHHELVMELARIKAVAVLNDYPDAIVIGSDTVVTVDSHILGKPRDRADACDMLRMLSGRSHHVYTGVCLAASGKIEQFYSRTEVFFYPLSEEEITRYVDTGEPFDKAGGYGIQGRGALLCRRIEGDYFNVVGLPVSLVSRKLSIFKKDVE
ncbi:MAG: nucleoside triphosphate pyrophosphatase [Acetanaerobacterium sp.]